MDYELLRNARTCREMSQLSKTRYVLYALYVVKHKKLYTPEIIDYICRLNVATEEFLDRPIPVSAIDISKLSSYISLHYLTNRILLEVDKMENDYRDDLCEAAVTIHGDFWNWVILGNDDRTTLQKIFLEFSELLSYVKYTTLFEDAFNSHCRFCMIDALYVGTGRADLLCPDNIFDYKTFVFRTFNDICNHFVASKMKNPFIKLLI